MTRVEALRILGLEPDATPDDVKKAYRQLVKAVHPDKNSAPNARHLFQLVQEAYEFISAVEPLEQTWENENTASDTRDRAGETRARTARERANREAKEKAAKEAKTQWERKRQRTSAPTGLWAFGGSCVLVFVGLCYVSGILAIVIIAGVGAFFGLRVDEIPFMGLTFLLVPILASILTRLVHVRLKKHQTRKSHNSHPR